MKLLTWLKNVTAARHFFIFVTLAIGLLCLYIYTVFFGTEKLNVGPAAFYGIISLFVIHWLWILISVIFHFIQKEWKPAIVKSILVILYALAIYHIYDMSTQVFYGVATSSDHKIDNLHPL